MIFNWTDDRIDKLRRMFAEGAAFSAIGAALGCSRNAALGKANRLLLVRTKTFKRSPIRPLPDLTFLEGDSTTRPREPDPSEVPIEQRKQLIDLTRESCRFPYGHVGDPGFFFCGGSALEGKPYCELHTRVAYQVR